MSCLCCSETQRGDVGGTTGAGLSGNGHLGG